MPERNLRWSDRALEENRKLIIYLFTEWNEDVMLRVQDQLDKSAIRIHNSPEQFPLFVKRKNIRRCVLSPQTSIFFKVNKTEIVIVSVFDNRQSPRKHKL